ncbi:MAG: MotA/TolQ/ExbB proton channel family protein [Spirochaetota bacterium]|nr:MotA/TolQ/ExbB proton channel family protein [Spirochaetota bacterium]
MKSDVIISLFDSIPLWVMILPIILCSIVSLAIIIERVIFYKRIKHDYRLIVRNILTLTSSGKIEEAKAFCFNYRGPIITMIRNVLETSSKKDDTERIILEYSGGVIRVLERNVGVLSTIATISPMLGLLGTVTGMMKSFSGLSRVGPVAHDLLAYGISEALITTAFGLLVAIPSLIFYNYMVDKIGYYITELEFVAKSLEPRSSLYSQ